MDTQAVATKEFFRSKRKRSRAADALKPISKGSRTKLAGVIAKNALWSSTTGRSLSCFFAIGRTK
jgi:hypothetical protein